MDLKRTYQKLDQDTFGIVLEGLSKEEILQGIKDNSIKLNNQQIINLVDRFRKVDIEPDYVVINTGYTGRFHSKNYKYVDYFAEDIHFYNEEYESDNKFLFTYDTSFGNGMEYFDHPGKFKLDPEGFKEETKEIFPGYYKYRKDKEEKYSNHFDQKTKDEIKKLIVLLKKYNLYHSSIAVFRSDYRFYDVVIDEVFRRNFKGEFATYNTTNKVYDIDHQTYIQDENTNILYVEYDGECS